MRPLCTGEEQAKNFPETKVYHFETLQHWSPRAFPFKAQRFFITPSQLARAVSSNIMVIAISEWPCHRYQYVGWRRARGDLQSRHNACHTFIDLINAIASCGSP